jgi:hypothetical protein
MPGTVAVSFATALQRKITPGKAEDAGNGYSLAKSSNTAWRNFSRNPQGRACFYAMQRFSTLIWNNHKNAGSVFARKPRRGEI